MKSITIAGNCTKDAELRTTQSGQSVAGFTVAVNGYENGENKAYFFDVSMWGKRGESIIQFATKGAKISVTGQLKTREHNGKTYLCIDAQDFTPMGGGQSNQGGQSGGDYDSGNQGGGYGSQGGGAGSADLDDGLPF